VSLSREQVEHVARLARVGITDEDVERFSHQLSDVLDYFDRLREVNTDDVPPTSHTLPLHNIMREDEPQPPLDVEVALANSPSTEDNRIRVRAILQE
jgi:aspartyl-tRNA(Asn)/glutamyl-tRNA(Gln) amidotransferase subunit C